MAYTKKTWTKGEIIKATDLNNMETGIEAVTDEVGTIGEHFDEYKGVILSHTEAEAPDIGTLKGGVVIPSAQSKGGVTYKTEITGGYGKIFAGVVKSNNKDYQIALGALTNVSAGKVSAFPWLTDYVDGQNVMRTEVNGTHSIVVGPNFGSGQYNVICGSNNAATSAGLSYIFGQFCNVSGILCATIGEGLNASQRHQTCLGVANDNKAEDIVEIGNGSIDTTAGTISRSNAFRVTKTGSAIAQTSLGIEDGNGGVVTITAEQLQALLALIPPQYEIKELTSSNRTYSMAAFDDISKLPTPTPYELQAQGYYLNTVSTTIAGLRMEGGVSPAINGAILKVTGGSTVNFNPGALDISYAMCEFNANMNQPIGGASPSTWLTESTTLKDTTAYIGIHFKVNSGEMTDQIRSQLLSTISIVSE